MLTQSLYIIYLIEVGLCLYFSFRFRKIDRSLLFVYFSVVLLFEAMSYFKLLENGIIYSIASFFYMLYFTYYYVLQLPSRSKMIFSVAGLCAILSAVFVIFPSDLYSAAIGFIVSMYFIFLSLLWFFHQVQNTDTFFITEKQAFWFSSAILFWSVTFLFRSSFMYWLAENDLPFLKLLDKIFKIALVLTYFSFLVGMTRRKFKFVL